MKRDIISRLHEKPFLGHIIEKIFHHLDLKSLSFCKEVWPTEISKLKKTLRRDLKWVEKKIELEKLETFPPPESARDLVEKIFDDFNGGFIITGVRYK